MARHGSKHMAEIGRKGFATFTEKYFDGDRAAALTWLRTRANERQAATFADRELQRRAEAGEKAACVELPVYDAGDDGVPF